MPRLNLILDGTFEGATPFAGLAFQQCTTDEITVSTDHARSGTKSAKFILNKDDCDVAGSRRTEVNRPSTAEPAGSFERWYGVSFFLSNAWANDTAPEIVIQWHQLSGTGSPPIALWIQNGKWGMAYNGVNTTDLGTTAKNVWTDWVFHMKWDSGAAGLFEAWRNGTKVITKTGANKPTETHGPYLKSGIYKWYWKAYPNLSQTTQRILYIDELRVGNELATYNDVVPGEQSVTTTTTHAPTTTTTTHAPTTTTTTHAPTTTTTTTHTTTSTTTTTTHAPTTTTSTSTTSTTTLAPTTTTTTSTSTTSTTTGVPTTTTTTTAGPTTTTTSTSTTSTTTTAELPTTTTTSTTTSSTTTTTTAVPTTTTTTTTIPNTPPEVDAGSDKVVYSPSFSTYLYGQVSDPGGFVVSHKWTKISGGNADIRNPYSLNTSVTGLNIGTYLFKLTATDNRGAVSSDVVKVTVYPRRRNQKKK